MRTRKSLAIAVAIVSALATASAADRWTPGPEFKVLHKNSLGEMALVTPAIASKSLVLRTASSLYRIAKK